MNTQDRPASGAPSGAGLSALLGEDGDDYGGPGGRAGRRAPSPVELIDPGRFQPRRQFDKDELAALTQSIREHGVLQPILVRHHPDNPARYELIAGERRWLAAQAAQLHEIPALIKDLGDREVLEIALVENIQRQDLTPLEEAAAYQRLIAEFGHTQEDLGERVGKSRSHIANTLRLLQLPDAVKGLINNGQLSAGHARALLGGQGSRGHGHERGRPRPQRAPDRGTGEGREGGTGPQPPTAPRARPRGPVVGQVARHPGARE